MRARSLVIAVLVSVVSTAALAQQPRTSWEAIGPAKGKSILVVRNDGESHSGKLEQFQPTHSLLHVHSSFLFDGGYLRYEAMDASDAIQASMEQWASDDLRGFNSWAPYGIAAALFPPLRAPTEAPHQ